MTVRKESEHSTLSQAAEGFYSVFLFLTMDNFRYNRAVIKVGTETITDNGVLRRDIIANIVDGIAAIRERVNNVIVVTSGAVAVGRADMRGAEDFAMPDESSLAEAELLELKRMYASVGQPLLHSMYAEEFRRHGLRAPQVLLRRPDELGSVVESALRTRSLVPVINENDAIASTQFFSDNDDLAQHVAEISRADLVVFLTKADGVLRDVHDDSTRISQIAADSEEWKQWVKRGEKSVNGKGDMYSKCERAQALARQGIATYVAHGRKRDVLQNLLIAGSEGTYFATP